MNISKKTMNMAYGLGAAIVIIGALMKITHFSAGFLTGNLMLTIGLVTEALIFALSAFDPSLAKEDVDYKWENVYPELVGGESSGKGESAQGMLSKKIDKMLKEAKLDANTVASLTKSIKDFESSAKAGSDSAESLAKINKQFADNANKLQEQMGALASNLESLNSVYGGVLSAMNKK
jgi:gliding motility-associated protein GldL